MLRFLRLLLCLLLIPVPAMAAGKPKGPFIGMHPEGDAREGPRMVRPDTINGEKKFFRISPEVSGRHFGGYTAFAAQDGSFGAAFKLKEEGVRAVQILCSTYQGKLVRIIVNGRPVDVQQLDQPPTDGRIIVWSGLTRQDLLLFDNSMKRIGGVDPKQL